MTLIDSKFFQKDRPGRKLLDLINSGRSRVFASGVKGSSPAFFSSMLFDILRKHFFIVAPSHAAAREIHSELQFFRNRSGGGSTEGAAEVLLFPPLDTQPYENVLSHCDLSSQRLWTLYRLCDAAGPCIVVTTVRAALQRVLSPEDLIDACQCLERGSDVDRDRLCARLVECGFTRVGMVEDRGDFSVRGAVLDVFLPGYDRPVRLDFFGDAIESIRLFDPVSQRSCADLIRVDVVPVREVILSRAVIEGLGESAGGTGADVFQHRKGRAFLESLQGGFLPSGIEYCLSYVYKKIVTVFDYLPEDSVVFWTEPRGAEAELQRLGAEVQSHYRAACEERRVASPPGELFLGGDRLEALPIDLQQVFFEGWSPKREGAAHVQFETRGNEEIRQDLLSCDTQTGALGAHSQKIAQWLADGTQVCLICQSLSQCARLAEIFGDYGIESLIHRDRLFSDIIVGPHENRIEILVGRLSSGFRYGDGLLAVITEEEIFGEKKRRARAPHLKSGTAISDFSDLKEGNLVVHRDNGIGIYRGLAALEAGGVRADYLTLEYLGGDKLYLPVDRINLINKYEQAEDLQPRVDKLGGTAWVRIKKRVRESVEKIARDLIELYSARKVYQGHAFSPPDHYYREFEASFPFEETPDQLAAIQEVMADMSGKMPMDRLICGDVGYGKTEVALRAGFRSVMDGKQVAVFVPTTVLAQQHYQTFLDRFAPYPVRVEILSRFRSAKDQKRIIADLAGGKVDIIIGTHRLVSPDVVFKDLGLLVIDEEHRFGVKHKEKLKKIKATVDVLTLTATPIPRTLQLSLFGIRDFSIIETPPQDRLSIRTVITHFEDGVIRDAILRELKRGGQVFFVHDRVRSIPAMTQYLRRLVPEIRLGIAHGQMKEHELETSMMAFIKKDVDVLLCTTIIESGLDFPTANTIIINNAQRLGLAQMYQLRGRVGRGKVRAYAYLLVPGQSIVGRDAARRLEALSEFTELGSGYRLAARDLQIRGAGNLLGHSQSGQMAAVGIDMYLELLNEAITELRGAKVPPRIDPEVNLKVQAYLPDDYVQDVNQRLVLYRRIASAAEDEDVADLEAEMADRFGRLPPPVQRLLEVARLKNLLRENLVTAVDSNGRQLVFTYHENAESSLGKILALVESNPRRFRFSPDLKRFADGEEAGGGDILQAVRKILQ